MLRFLRKFVHWVIRIQGPQKWCRIPCWTLPWGPRGGYQVPRSVEPIFKHAPIFTKICTLGNSDTRTSKMVSDSMLDPPLGSEGGIPGPQVCRANFQTCSDFLENLYTW